MKKKKALHYEGLFLLGLGRRLAIEKFVEGYVVKVGEFYQRFVIGAHDVSFVTGIIYPPDLQFVRKLLLGQLFAFAEFF